jgi:hypothetical protein
MNTIEKLEKALATAKSEASSFFEKGNKSAGTRARVALQEVKNLAQVLRIEIQDAKK